MKKTSIIFWGLVTVIPIIGVIISISDPQSFEAAQNRWQDKIMVFGALAPVAFIILQAAQVIFTPISHYSVGVVGGFLFGPFLGAFYNWFGRMIGHISAFLLSRTIGRPIVERFVSPATIHKYDKITSDKSLPLFLIYFLPLFPDDEISYLAGLSQMKFKMFFFANAFGHVGGSLGLAYIGSGIDTKDPLFWTLFIVTLLGFPLLWYLVRKRNNENV